MMIIIVDNVHPELLLVKPLARPYLSLWGVIISYTSLKSYVWKASSTQSWRLGTLCP